MTWDDLRFVLEVSRSRSLLGAAKTLRVNHTTVGRRIAAAEASLGVRLFTRTASGYVPTLDADRLLEPMRAVEEAVLTVQRQASGAGEQLAGLVRVTGPESFGIGYLASRLAAFGAERPSLTIALDVGGQVRDLGRREAEVAVRFFRSKDPNVVARRSGAVRYGAYASAAYLQRRPVRAARDLAHHRMLMPPPAAGAVDTAWIQRLTGGCVGSFVSEISLVLLEAARASAGVAVLPRYLGDADASLRHIPLPDEPSDTLWLTVHKDLRSTPRVRAVLDFLTSSLRADAPLLLGARAR